MTPTLVSAPAAQTSAPPAVVGHVPPHASAIEMAVLGALMLESSAPRTVFGLLTSEAAFYVPAHRLIFAALRRLFEAGQAIDQLTAVTQLSADGVLQRVGGAYYVANLTAHVNSAAHLESHCRILQQFQVRREIITLGLRLSQYSYDDAREPLDLLADAQLALTQLHHGLDGQPAQTSATLFDQYFARLSQAVTTPGPTGIPTPLTELNQATGGWQNGDLVVIAARPGMGKTAAMLSFARTAALDYGCPTAIFSLEMPALDLMGRLVTSEVEGYTNAQLRRGEVAGGVEAVGQLATQAKRLHTGLLHFDDGGELTIHQLRAKVARLVAERGVRLVLVDYLQLMSGPQNAGRGNREQEISSITRGLKALAKELDIPIIALSQLSRDVEKRGGEKRPQLSDLRESGSIEQDADLVLFLWRGAYYKIDEYSDGSPTADTVLLDIAKHRNGALVEIIAGATMHNNRFFDLDEAAPVLRPLPASQFGREELPF